jgi:predicted solute-binding protein
MTVLIDDSLATTFLTCPVREAWIENPGNMRVVAGISDDDITVDDVALIPTAVATRLVETHVIDRSVAVIHEGIGMTSLWTPVRADEIEEDAVYLEGVGVASEVLARALLKPYFGIVSAGITLVDASPEEARVIVREGAAALTAPEGGFREDLARTWFILTGMPFVSHVTVVGVRALARDADEQLAVLRALVETGHERRRDVRRIMHEATGVDRGVVAEVTVRMRYHLAPEDAESVRRLVEMGTWGTRFGRSLPAYRDQLGTDESVDEGQ